MKGDPVPNSDHVARYCGASQIDDGTISGAAFRLRPTEDFLSVNWLEKLHRTRDGQIRALRQVLGAKLRLGKNARIAVLNVGGLIDHVLANTPDRRRLQVLHQPERSDPSHSGIVGFSAEDDLIADLIAQTVERDYPARS